MSNPFDDQNSTSSWPDSVTGEDTLDLPMPSPAVAENIPTSSVNTDIVTISNNGPAILSPSAIESPYPGLPPPESEAHRIKVGSSFIEDTPAPRSSSQLQSALNSRIHAIQLEAILTDNSHGSNFAPMTESPAQFHSDEIGPSMLMKDSFGSIIDREEDGSDKESSNFATDDSETDENGFNIETFSNGILSHQAHKNFIISLLDEFLVHHRTEGEGALDGSSTHSPSSDSFKNIGTESLHITEKFVMSKCLKFAKCLSFLTYYVAALTKALQGFGCPTHVLDFHLTQVMLGHHFSNGMESYHSLDYIGLKRSRSPRCIFSFSRMYLHPV
jgi:hypothetical protein